MTRAETASLAILTVLEVTVNNHPGVLMHVCGLFSRRAYNVDGVLCMPIGNGSRSRIWLKVNEDKRLEQVIKQLLKLEDVLEVQRHGADHAVFLRLVFTPRLQCRRRPLHAHRQWRQKPDLAEGK